MVSFDSPPPTPSSCFGRRRRIVSCSPLTCSRALTDLCYLLPLSFCQAEVLGLFSHSYIKAISYGSQVWFRKMILSSAWLGLWEISFTWSWVFQAGLHWVLVLLSPILIVTCWLMWGVSNSVINLDQIHASSRFFLLLETSFVFSSQISQMFLCW